MIETERIIANVNATMAMEGMPLTDTDKQRIKDCLDGTSTFKDEVKKLVEQYKKEIITNALSKKDT